MADTNKCAHEPCTCNARPGSKYCSDSCEREGATGMTHLRCNCGHPGCQ